MKKAFLLLFLLLMAVFCAVAAADTVYSLSPCPGTVTIPDANYIILTPENVSSHPDLLAKIGKTQEELLSDWEERGVILQAWFQAKKMDSCLEIIVRQDADSSTYYDLVNHPKDNGWKTFISSHKGVSAYSEEGYSVKEAEKKQQTGHNYFLRLKYKHTADSKVYWGYAAKAVARGYTVILDYQVYDRGLRSGDQNQLNKITNTIQFYDGDPAAVTTPSGSSTEASSSPSSPAYLQITSAPPVETNSDTFTVEGRTTPGARVIGVLMRINSADPVLFYADANAKNGDFRMKITLPEENIWLMTMNVEMNGQIVSEQAFSTTTYKKTAIPVSFDSEVPEALSADETVVSGVTDKSVTVQCIVTNGISTFEKQITTNGTGKFTFKIPTAREASYHFTLVFSKKNHDTKRFTYDAVRNLTDEDRRAAIRKDAIKPGFSTLTRNLDKYVGKTMGYSLYIVDTQPQGEEWIITTAMIKNNTGYRNYLYFLTDDDPELEAGSQHLMYGTCIGPYVFQSEEGTEQYPAFDLLFIAD